MTNLAARLAHRQLLPSTGERIHRGVASVTGRCRERNEGASLAGAHGYVVADGMGGNAAGEVAGRVVVDTFASATPILPIPSCSPGITRTSRY